MKIQVREQIYFFKDQQIIRFEAKQELSKMFLASGECRYFDIEIDNLDKQLKYTSFIRVHPDHIINVDFISKLSENKMETIVLEDGTEIPSSTETINRIVQFLKKHINL